MNDFLGLAKDAALSAGELLKKRCEKLLDLESNAGHDLKLKRI